MYDRLILFLEYVVYRKNTLFNPFVITRRLASSIRISRLLLSINLLAFYHGCCFLIGYITHYLFCRRMRGVRSLTVCGSQENGGRFLALSKCL